MNQLLRFRSIVSFLNRTPIRPFHLSSTRSIEWADIDEYTNKVNNSVFLTTDVYEKDDEWIQFEARQNERLRKRREEFLLGPPKRKSVSSTNKDSKTCPSAGKFTRMEPDVKYDPDDDRPRQMDDPYLPSPHKCVFCENNLKIDFRNTELLSQFISPQTGFVFNQRTTGLCYFKQVELEKAILKARRFHLMPYKWKETVYLDDPRLFNPYDNNMKKITFQYRCSMTDSTNPSANSSSKKDSLFWGKIVATQYLIRHPFWKSFSLPIIIGQISASTQTDYTSSNYLIIVYVLIAFHFLSGIFVSDRKFRHALGFIPHIIALGCTSYLFYSNILQQLTPWLKIRIIIHALGTISAFCFIASLHTSSISFRAILRRLSSYSNVFYLIVNSYVLWWSTDETNLFDNFLWTFIIRFHAILCFLVSGGFCLDIFIIQSCQLAIYLICSNLALDFCILYRTLQSSTDYWLLIDYIVDDIAVLCGCFYLYQFNVHQKIKLKKKD
ncbi:hypothetical protein I4U23_028472 [Adineta vaga]|nr:hypothetical protein I4U23_028472 [Adineta vaga]